MCCYLYVSKHPDEPQQFDLKENSTRLEKMLKTVIQEHTSMKSWYSSFIRLLKSKQPRITLFLRVCYDDTLPCLMSTIPFHTILLAVPQLVTFTQTIPHPREEWSIYVVVKCSTDDEEPMLPDHTPSSVIPQIFCITPHKLLSLSETSDTKVLQTSHDALAQ